MNYEKLKGLSNKIVKLEKNLTEDDALNPPKFNERIKYLFFGCNPAKGKNKPNQPSLYTIEFREEYKNWFREWTRKNKDAHKYKYMKYENYFNKPMKLIDFDKDVGIAWENEDYMNLLKKSKEYDGHHDFLDELWKKADDCGFLNRPKCAIFADLFYLMETNQKDARAFIEKPDVKEKIKEFFSAQMEYYKPENVVVINAFVSNFIIQNIYLDQIKSLEDISVYHDHEKQIKFFFSGMITGQRGLDNFSFARLKKEIQKSVKHGR